MPEDEDQVYAEKYWIWIILFLLFLSLAIGITALILQFFYSAPYPTGFNVVPITTQVSGNYAVPSATVTAENRSLYVFNSPPTGGAITGSLPISNIKAGMQFMVFNNTLLPLAISTNSTTPTMSGGEILATQTTKGTPSYNTCIPSTDSGTFVLFKTTSIIPAGATYSFVSPVDNKFNLVQSSLPDVINTGSVESKGLCN